MNATHRKTLRAIFTEPAPASLEWRRIERLFVALGCAVVEGAGSAVTFEMSGAKAYFHRPHPGKEARRYQVRDARAFLERIGVKHEGDDL